MKRLAEKGMTLPILYVYDSFLFEYNLDEGIERAKEIKEVLESLGFPVKASWGENYDRV